jgi:hypothetical protein
VPEALPEPAVEVAETLTEMLAPAKAAEPALAVVEPCSDEADVSVPLLEQVPLLPQLADGLAEVAVQASDMTKPVSIVATPALTNAKPLPKAARPVSKMEAQTSKKASRLLPKSVKPVPDKHRRRKKPGRRQR